MTFQSLSTIFSDKKSLQWQDEDIRFFVERYIGEKMNRLDIYCQVLADLAITIRVPSPLMYQEVYLLTSDLKAAIKKESGRDVGRVKVIF